ncbi:MAG: glycosyltransferase, partial [Dehalococcoidia bacterium]|nr:glycosyltransferase [Dehalococcoidia bacterium]
TARLAEALKQLGASIAIVTSAANLSGGGDRGPDLAANIGDWNWGERKAVIEALARQAPDVVNIQYPTQNYGRRLMINFLPFFVRWSLKVPVVFTVHEFCSFTWLGRLRIALSSALSDAVIVPDRENLASMARTFPFLQSKIRHVPIGPSIVEAKIADFNREDWRRGFQASEDTLVIAYFGFLSPSKGVETLLEALELVAREEPELDWRLLLIADREPADDRYAEYHRRIEQLLHSSPVRDLVHLTGYCSEQDVSQYLQSSDICVLPFSDGATMRRTTLLCALTHGLPVISTYPQGRLDLELEEGRNVMLVPANNAGALARSIVRLAKDREKRQHLAAGARKLAGCLSWEEIGRRTLEVFAAARAGKEKAAK